MSLRTIRNPSCFGKTFHGLSVFRMKYVHYKQNIHSDDFFLFTVTREQALVQKWYNKVVLAAVYPFIGERDILQSSRTHERTRTRMNMTDVH